MSKAYPSAVIKIAKEEVGYQEKKTNAYLEYKHKNAGANNYTKYGKEQGCNGQAWCDAFVDWCFIKAYGKEKARELLIDFSNYTPTSAQYFKNKKQYIKRGQGKPKVGDVIFFYSSSMGRICHTGLVYKVSGNTVYTIEGNTSGNSSEFERDGGQVAYKQYDLSNSRIDGYGRPKYDKQEKVKVKKKGRLYKKLSTTKGYYKTLSVDSEVIFIEDQKNGWSKVKSGSDTGYMKNVCLNKKLSKYPIGTLNADAGLKEKNNKLSLTMLTLAKGTKVRIVSVGKYWTECITDAGRGFISTKKIDK